MQRNGDISAEQNDLGAVVEADRLEQTVPLELMERQ
jgi:hypothetical protein